jgi:predicted regulator of Ras-like GTPase activity (Roadblock/LC7/MglB family)
MTMATEKIFIGIDNDKIELTGADKEAFLEQRAKDQAELGLLEAEAEAKKQARIDAITKLGQASGLTTEEIESILNI